MHFAATACDVLGRLSYVGEGWVKTCAFAGPRGLGAFNLGSEAASPVVPVGCLASPSQANPPTGVLPAAQGPPSVALFIYGAYLLSSKEDLWEAELPLVGKQSVMGVRVKCSRARLPGQTGLRLWCHMALFLRSVSQGQWEQLDGALSGVFLKG